MKEQAIRGALWTLADKLGGQIFSLLSFLILTRQLSPDDFGVVSLALAVVGIAGIFLNEGFGSALIQRREISDAHINAAFWANVVLSVLVTALLIILAPYVSEYSGKPLTGDVLRWISWISIGTALSSIAGSLYIRQLKFAKFALRSLISMTAGSVVGIVMAVTGWGVWSLVGFQLVQSSAATATMWWGLSWRPSLGISFQSLREIGAVCSRIIVGNFFRLLADKADIIVVGYFLSSTSLGFYYLVLRVIMMLEVVILTPLDSVMLPVLSRMQNDLPRLRTYYLEMVWTATAFWLPAALGLGAIALRLFPVLFGAQWAEAAPMMVGASLIGLSGAFLRATSHLLLAVGRAGLYPAIHFIKLIVVVTVMAAAARLGPVSVGYGYALVSLLMLPVHLAVVKMTGGTSR